MQINRKLPIVIAICATAAALLPTLARGGAKQDLEKAIKCAELIQTEREAVTPKMKSFSFLPQQFLVVSPAGEKYLKVVDKSDGKSLLLATADIVHRAPLAAITRDTVLRIEVAKAKPLFITVRPSEDNPVIESKLLSESEAAGLKLPQLKIATGKSASRSIASVSSVSAEDVGAVLDALTRIFNVSYHKSLDNEAERSSPDYADRALARKAAYVAAVQCKQLRFSDPKFESSLGEIVESLR